MEAHNDYVQLAAEGGLREVRRRVREGARDTTMDWIRVGAVTGLDAIGSQEVIKFSLQMPGNAALFVVLAAIALRKA